MISRFKIKVPASSANIGPGYDVLGVSLCLYLELDVSIDPKKAYITNDDPNNCKLMYTSNSEGFPNITSNSDKNLITKAALYVLRCNNIRKFPPGTEILVHNGIFLGRGLGSSGAAVVAGVILGNQIGKLGFSKQRMLDYCLMIERHPDNITASIMGGFCGSFLRDLTPEESKACEVSVSRALQDSTEGKDTDLIPPSPPTDISHHVKYKWNSQIKCVVIIPDFEVLTEDSRNILPKTYSAKDVVFNLQRLAVLTNALSHDVINPDLIYFAMQDALHQPYRKLLIPGLSDIFSTITPSMHPGLLGICISGSGPTILALATKNYENIAQAIINTFNKFNVRAIWKLLDLCMSGSVVEDI